MAPVKDIKPKIKVTVLKKINIRTSRYTTNFESSPEGRGTNISLETGSISGVMKVELRKDNILLTLIQQPRRLSN